MARDKRKEHCWKGYTLIIILSLLYLHVGSIQQAIGSESIDEPLISLKVENKPLGDVLKKIAQDTDFKFSLNDPWFNYLVNASIDNMPLHRGLKLILRRLNHTIIYESNKSIKIVVYENVDSRKTDSNPIRSLPSRIQDNRQAFAPLPKLPPEEKDDLSRGDDTSEQKNSSEDMKDKSAEKEDSSANRKKVFSKGTGAAAGKELDQDSSRSSENTDEQNESINNQ